MVKSTTLNLRLISLIDTHQIIVSILLIQIYKNIYFCHSDPNKLTNASNIENGIDIEDTPENQSRIRTRKRLHRRQKQKIKSLADKYNTNPNEQNRSTTNSIEYVYK